MIILCTIVHCSRTLRFQAACTGISLQKVSKFIIFKFRFIVEISSVTLIIYNWGSSYTKYKDFVPGLCHK